MLVELWNYFGIVGMISIALWMMSWLTAIIHFTKKTRSLTPALLLALTAFIFAAWNSRNILQIEEDRSSMIAKQDEQRRAEVIERRKSELNTTIRFAEDNTSDILDLAGIKSTDNPYEKALIEEADTPAWRMRGVKQRSVSDSQAQQSDFHSEFDAMKHRRSLPAEEYAKANLYDMRNMLFARFTVWCVLILFIADYLYRFNHEKRKVIPIPISSSWIDSISKKEFFLQFQRGTNVQEFTKERICRGETVIWLCSKSIALPDVFYSLFYFLLPKKIISCTSDFDLEDGFMFESAWYGRHSFLIEGEERSVKWFRSFLDSLHLRWQTSARAYKTINIIWDLDRKIPSNWLRDIAPYASSSNIRVVIFSEIGDEKEWSADACKLDIQNERIESLVINPKL